MTSVDGNRPRLLYVVSEDWYFISHRLPMARAAQRDGFEVHVATRTVDHGQVIKAEGFILHPIPFARGRLSPLSSWATVQALRRLHEAVTPDIVHHVALQACVLGVLAALGKPAACVNALTGLGYAFTSASGKARLVRAAIAPALRLLLDRKHAVTLVQNNDDRAALIALGIAPTRIVIVRGSGVDVTRFAPLPEPAGQFTAGFVGRLLDDKGIRTLIAAHRLLRAQGNDVRLLIAGDPDSANPASVTVAEAASWNNEPGLSWLAHVDDIPRLWAKAHIAVLPSRREGLPLSLLEAAACRRAMIASDVPGCREIVIDGQTGILVPVDDPTALAEAVAKLAAAPDLRARYAETARRLVVEQFSAESVGRDIVQLYRGLLGNHFAQGTRM